MRLSIDDPAPWYPGMAGACNAVSRDLHHFFGPCVPGLSNFVPGFVRGLQC